MNLVTVSWLTLVAWLGLICLVNAWFPRPSRTARLIQSLVGMTFLTVLASTVMIVEGVVLAERQRTLERHIHERFQEVGGQFEAADRLERDRLAETRAWMEERLAGHWHEE